MRLNRASPLTTRICAVLATAFVAVQLITATALAPSSPDPKATYHEVKFPDWWAEKAPDFTGLAGKYRRLIEWDSLHYLSIAQFGYTLSNPPFSNIHGYRDNMAFFPGFPMTARAAHLVTGMPAEIALLVTAQLMGWFCWFYLFLILSQNGLKTGRAVTTAALVLAFPTAFYLVLPYSESTFIMAILGFYYWYRRARKAEGLARLGLMGLSIFHGALVTGTRLVGLPIVLIPLIIELAANRKKEKTHWDAATAVSILSLLGIVIFFSHLQGKFGNWRVHFIAQTIGWGNKSDLLAFFRWQTYLPWLEAMDGHRRFDDLSRIMVPGFFVFFIVMLRRYWNRWKKFFWDDLPLLYAAMGLYGIAVVGRKAVRFIGMVRYFLPVVFVMACIRPSIVEQPLKNRTILVTVVLSALVQVLMMYQYLRGNWVS